MRIIHSGVMTSTVLLSFPVCLPKRSNLRAFFFFFTGTRDFVACNHLRSYKYYSDSIIYPDGFLGYSCTSYDAFQTVSIFQSLRMEHFKRNDSYQYM